MAPQGYVLVNPSRLTSLAKQLHALHASLSAEPESIRAPYHAWGSDLDVSPLKSAAGPVATQADKMDDRAVLAFAAMNMPRITSVGAEPPTMFGIKWDYTEDDLRVAASQVAMYLHVPAADYPSDHEAYNAAMEERIRQIGDLLDLNHDDTTFQEGFWPTAAPYVAKLANLLREGQDADDNQEPLSDDWRNVLSQYSSSFAAATLLAERREITLPPETYTPFTQAADEDMWSVGAFVASGPDGSQWGSQFLADAGTRVLQWRADHQGEIPTFFQGGTVGTSYVPSAIVGSDNGWYQAIGIDVGNGTYTSTDMEELQRRMGLIAANDPALAILGKLGQNQLASQLLLSDPEHGATNAQRLVQYDWNYTGTATDESSTPGRVIIQATSDRGPDAAGERSARAAGNVFDAVSAAANADRSDYQREQWPTLPPGLQDSITHTAVTYIPDLAASSDEYQDVTTTALPNGPGGLYTLQMDASSVVGVLDILRDDANGWGVFRAGTDTHLTNATTYQVSHPDSPDYIRQAVALDALAQLTENNEAYDAAAQRDADAARVAGYYDAASGALEGAALTGNPYIVAADVANKVLGPVLIDPLFDTSHAEEASEANARSTLDQLNSRTLWIAQGLINADHIDPPRDAPYMQDGNIVIENEADRAAFVAWWNQQPKEITDYEADARNMFNEITKAHEDNIEQFGG
jgi:hypothetical protein